MKIVATLLLSLVLAGCSMLSTPVPTITSKVASSNVDMTSNVVYANLWLVPTNDNTEVNHDA